MTGRGRKLAQQFLTRERLISAALTLALMGLSLLVVATTLGPWGFALSGVLVIVQVAASSNGEWVLRLQRAQRLPTAALPVVWSMLERLSSRAGVPAPALYLIPSPTPNAFATETSDGRGALGVTAGLLERLDAEELEAVLAHEISHLAAGDTRRSRWTAAAASAATTVMRISVWLGLILTLSSGSGHATWLVLLLASWGLPILFGVLQSALSRSREFAADTRAVSLTGRPLALASALSRLGAPVVPWLRRLLPARPRATDWLDSHPATHERIARLRAMAMRSASST